MVEEAMGTLLDGLQNLLAQNLLGDGQYRNRYNGFAAELYLADRIRHAREKSPLDGSVFVPLKRTDNPFDNAVCYTTSSDLPDNFEDIYTRIARIVTNDPISSSMRAPHSNIGQPCTSHSVRRAAPQLSACSTPPCPYSVTTVPDMNSASPR